MATNADSVQPLGTFVLTKLLMPVDTQGAHHQREFDFISFRISYEKLVSTDYFGRESPATDRGGRTDNPNWPTCCLRKNSNVALTPIRLHNHHYASRRG
jgi:hypothetical protein